MSSPAADLWDPRYAFTPSVNFVLAKLMPTYRLTPPLGYPGPATGHLLMGLSISWLCTKYWRISANQIYSVFFAALHFTSYLNIFTSYATYLLTSFILYVNRQNKYISETD